MTELRGWRSELPRVAAYVDQLPQGLASYPECAVARELLDGLVRRNSVEREMDLPPELTELLQPTNRHATWVPEAWYIALILAVADQHHRHGAASFVNDIAEPVAFLGPADVTELIRRGHAAFARVHQGTSEAPLHNGPGWSATAFLYPTLLIPSVHLDQMARVALAVLQRANMIDPNVEFRTEPDPRASGHSITVFTMRWNAASAQHAVEAADWRAIRDRLLATCPGVSFPAA